MKLFQILASDALASLALVELTEYRDALRVTAEKVYAKDAETIGDLTPSDLLEQMRVGVEAIEAANERIAALEAETDVDLELTQLAEQARGPEVDAEPEATPEPEAAPEPTAEADPETLEAETGETPAEPPAEEEPAAEATDTLEAETTEPEAEVAPEPEPMTASTPAPRPKLAAPSRSKAAKPRPKAFRPTLTASAEGLGIPVGSEFSDELGLAAAMIDKRRRFGHMTNREDVPIALMDWREAYPEDRHLDPRNGVEGNTAKIEALRASVLSDPNKGTERSLVAAGGICAPVTPYYELQVISVDDRPVRASFPAFLADRGGIQYATPPTLADVDEAIGIITSDEDALGGTSATKTCQVLECPDWNEVDIDILYHCVQTSNLTYRTFPEQLAQFNRLIMAGFARMAEKKLLDGIYDASTHVTAATRGYGAVGDLLGQILAAANGMRSRHRMNPEAILRIMLPDWSLDLMVSDVVRSQFARFDTDEARLTALLRSYDLEPTFYIDERTGGSQVFPAQSTGALGAFPTHVEWYLFPEGSFLFLDGGTLELGLVRDSVLNSTNEFQIFGESFENIAFIGVESLHVSSAVCDSGVVASPDDPTDCNYS